MRFRITSKINDGLGEAPPLEVEVKDIEHLLHEMLSLDTFTNDYGAPLGPGMTVLVERIV